MAYILKNVSGIALFKTDNIIFNVYEKTTTEKYIEVITNIQNTRLRNLFELSQIPTYIKSIQKYSQQTSTINEDIGGKYTLSGLDISDNNKCVTLASYSCNPIGTIIDEDTLDIESIKKVLEEHKNIYKSIYIAMKSFPGRHVSIA